MFPLLDFQRGPLCKPRIQIQAMAAFKTLEADYAPKTQKSTINPLMLDENCAWLRIMVCLQIANIEPNDWDWDQRNSKKCGLSIACSMSLSGYIALQMNGMRSSNLLSR
jgi:hypothetical protein